MTTRFAAFGATLMLAVSMFVAPGTAAATPQQSQPAQVPPIEVTRVSSGVAAEGTWSVAFDVAGAPADATVSYSIGQALSGTEPQIRDALTALRERPRLEKLLLTPKSLPLAQTLVEGTHYELKIEVRSSRASDDRAFLPTGGIFPVRVVIDSPSAGVLGQSIVLLIHSAASVKPAPISILWQRSAWPNPYNERGEPTVATRATAALDELIEVAKVAPPMALTVSVDPATLSATDETSDTSSQQRIDALRTTLHDAEVLRPTWVPLRLENWAQNGRPADLQLQLTAALESLTATLKATPTEQVWPLDSTIGPRALARLTKNGTDQFIVDPAMISAKGLPVGETGFSAPLDLNSGSQSGQVFQVDPLIKDRLATSGNPALISNEVLALAAARAFGNKTQHGTVVVLDESSAHDNAVAFAEALSRLPADAPLELMHLNELFSAVPATRQQSGVRGQALNVALLAPAASPSVSSVSNALVDARKNLDAFTAMRPDNAMTNRLSIMLATSQHESLSVSQQLRAITRVDDSVAREFGALTMPSRSITVTSRETTLFIRIDNTSRATFNARLIMKSPRLTFVNGAERKINVTPGVNKIAVPVRVRGSGEFLLRIALTPPGSDQAIATSGIKIRSTTFSGVGLMLSGSALLFLVIWWTRTLRRSRK
jgi:hypothetical protein